jgi:sulfite exporter TauE/SafE/copper chaperone CopZ
MNKVVEIKGMHCRSCEILIEDELKKILGVTDVKVSSDKAEAVVTSTIDIPESDIANAVKNAGYEVGTSELPLISEDSDTYKYLVFAGVILAAILILGKIFGLGRFFAGYGSTNSSLLVVFTVGLTAGFSSCMALVGGLVLGASARFAEKHPNAAPIQKFRPHLFFNLGRIISYLILGGAIGALGSVLRLSGPTLGIITLTVGFVMLLLGLQLTEIFPRFSSVLTLPKGLSRILKMGDKNRKEYSHVNSMILGALTFFLPCGFTQAMQVYAISTGKVLSGALIMGVFALGTTPGLLSVGGVTSVLKQGNFSKIFFKFVALVLIVLAIFNLSNGLSLTGFKLLLPKSSGTNSTQSLEVKNAVQVVNMAQDSRGYHPNKFTVKKGIPVKWVITSDSSFSCAKSIYMTEMNINKTLNTGENVIEFTPSDAGTLNFSCSMGMYRGQFTVE